MIIITLPNFSQTSVTPRSQPSSRIWSPPWVSPLKVKLSSAPLRVSGLHVLSRTGHT